MESVLALYPRLCKLVGGQRWNIAAGLGDICSVLHLQGEERGGIRDCGGEWDWFCKSNASEWRSAAFVAKRRFSLLKAKGAYMGGRVIQKHGKNGALDLDFAWKMGWISAYFRHLRLHKSMGSDRGYYYIFCTSMRFFYIEISSRSIYIILCSFIVSCSLFSSIGTAQSSFPRAFRWKIRGISHHLNPPSFSVLLVYFVAL